MNTQTVFTIPDRVTSRNPDGDRRESMLLSFSSCWVCFTWSCVAGWLTANLGARETCARLWLSLSSKTERNMSISNEGESTSRRQQPRKNVGPMKSVRRPLQGTQVFLSETSAGESSCSTRRQSSTGTISVTPPHT